MIRSHTAHRTWRDSLHHISCHAAHLAGSAFDSFHACLHINIIHVKASLCHNSIGSIATCIQCGTKSTFWRVTICKRFIKGFHTCINACFHHFRRNTKFFTCLTDGVHSCFSCFFRAGTICHGILKGCHANLVHIWHLIIKHVCTGVHADICCLTECIHWRHVSVHALLERLYTGFHTCLNHLRRKSGIHQALRHAVACLLSCFIRWKSLIEGILKCLLPLCIIIFHKLLLSQVETGQNAKISYPACFLSSSASSIRIWRYPV